MPTWLTQLVVGIVLATQVLVGGVPTGLVLCLNQGVCGEAALAADQVQEAAGCCKHCVAEPAPEPAPQPQPAHGDCPAGCGCCLEIGVPPTTRGLDLVSSSADLQRLLIHTPIAAALATRPAGEHAGAHCGRIPHPPDSRVQRIAPGLGSTRLII